MHGLSFDDLIAYNDWQRARWRAFFRERPDALALSLGDHGDGRFATVGEVVRHIFGAELRYVQRLIGEPLSDLADVPADDVEKLFDAGEDTRQRFRELIRMMPEDQWDIPRRFTVLKYHVTATPKKIVAHTLIHEVRHWAQLATICRMCSHRRDPDDLLAGPLWGGEFVAAQD